MLESITRWFGNVVLRASPELDNSPLLRASQWQCTLMPEELLSAYYAQVLAERAISMSTRCSLPRLKA